jgi:hypothetical protein
MILDIIQPLIQLFNIYIIVLTPLKIQKRIMENMYSVLITAITVLGGTTAFRFYEKRAMRKERDEEFIRHDCKDRISKLEGLLEAAGKEKDDLRMMILDLTKQVAALSVKVEFLTKENEKLAKTSTKSDKKQLSEHL